MKNPLGVRTLRAARLNAAQDACAYLLARPKIDIRPLALSHSPLNISFDLPLFLRKRRDAFAYLSTLLRRQTSLWRVPRIRATLVPILLEQIEPLRRIRAKISRMA